MLEMTCGDRRWEGKSQTGSHGPSFFYRFTVPYKLDRKKVMKTQNNSELYLLSY